VPIGQSPDEAALLESSDQPMDAGLGAQIERILHLIDDGDAGLLERSWIKRKSSACLRINIVAFSLRPNPEQS